MNKSFFLLLAFLVPNALICQEKIDKELLKKDLDVLKSNLETYHTGLNTYTSKQDLDRWFTETKDNLQDATPLDFFKKVVELNELIKNGHTFFHINPAQRGENLLMPSFTIYEDKAQFYVKSVQSKEYSGIIGKRIISINEVPIEEVFEALLVYEERDGNNTTQPKEELLFSFARKYALEYGNSEQTRIEIEENGKSKLINLPNVAFGEEVQKTDELFDNGGVYSTVKDSIATLTIETFNEVALKKTGYKSKLKAFFTSVKNNNVKHLIIDVRNKLSLRVQLSAISD